MKVKISKTVYPPKQPTIWKWMEEFKVGTRIEIKSFTNKAEQMNQFYNFKQIKS